MKPIAILGLLMLLFASCDRQEEVNDGEYADLTFKIATSSINSRGNVSDNPYNTSQWTDAEKLIDGRSFYTLSVYLVDSDQQIADYKILPLTNATEAIVTFEGVKKGNYTLYAVANNSAQSIENKTYNSGLLESWKDSNFNALINNKIGISSDKVSAKDVIQPLSLVKNITLHAGKNYETGELKRTYARLRIVVENNSTVLPLQIKSLTFNEKFTQTQAYVFDDGTDRKYFGTLGAPLSTSSLALQPFTPNTDNGILEIAPDNSSIVFDGYILESKLTGDDVYQYTLDLLYESKEEEVVSRASDDEAPWTEVRNPADITDGEYLICDYASYIYITTQNKTIEAGAVYGTYFYQNTDVDDAHVWLISKTSDGKYYIKNKATGQYLQDPTRSYVGLDANNPYAFSITSHTVESYSTYLEIKGSTYSIYPSYFYVYGSSPSSSTRIVLHRRTSQTPTPPTPPPSTTITFNDPITLTTIDPVTQQASVTKEIKRNDFINVHVTVSFNSVAGKIEYVVRDWTTVNGDIEFD